MKTFVTTLGLIASTSAASVPAIPNGTLDYVLQAKITVGENEIAIKAYYIVKFEEGILKANITRYLNAEFDHCGSGELAVNKEAHDVALQELTGLLTGVYSMNGQPLENPDPEKWTNTLPTDNIFWSVDGLGGQFYSATMNRELNFEIPVTEGTVNTPQYEGTFTMTLPTCTDEQKEAIVDAKKAYFDANMEAKFNGLKTLTDCDAEGACADDMSCGTVVFKGETVEKDTRTEGCVETTNCGKGMPEDEDNKEGLDVGDGRLYYYQCGNGLRLFASAASIFASVALAM